MPVALNCLLQSRRLQRHGPSFFNVSHFSAEISGRKRRHFYGEDTIKMSRIRFLLSIMSSCQIFPCFNFAFAAGHLKLDFSLVHSSHKVSLPTDMSSSL